MVPQVSLVTQVQLDLRELQVPQVWLALLDLQGFRVTRGYRVRLVRKAKLVRKEQLVQPDQLAS